MKFLPLFLAGLVMAGSLSAKEPTPSTAQAALSKASISASAKASSSPGIASVPNEAELVEHNQYVNKQGHQVHSPAHTVTGGAPDGASAKCKDGTYSFSQSRRGTCSHHGGVENWLR